METMAPSQYKIVLSMYGDFHYKDKTVGTGKMASSYWYAAPSLIIETDKCQ